MEKLRFDYVETVELSFGDGEKKSVEIKRRLLYESFGFDPEKLKPVNEIPPPTPEEIATTQDLLLDAEFERKNDQTTWRETWDVINGINAIPRIGMRIGMPLK